MINIVVLPVERYQDWDEFVETNSSGSIYSCSSYLRILSKVTDGNFRIVVAEKQGKILAGVGVYETQSLAGKTISSRLLLYYNGFVISDQEEAAQLLALFEKYFSAQQHSRILFHCRGTPDSSAFKSKDWHVSETQTYLVNLTDIDSLWKKIDKNQRRLIRRAEESEITVTSDDDFESFYKLHMEIHIRKGAPLYLSQNKFREYFSLLKEAGLCSLFNARASSGEIAASQLVLHSKHPVTHTVCAGSSEKYLNTGVTPFLRWQSFVTLSKQGYKFNDLTDAADNNVSRFKKQLGAELCTNLLIKRQDSLLYNAEVTIKRISAKLLKLLR